jgi:hypothetical protein
MIIERLTAGSFHFVKHDLKESVEVYKGRNLHLPPRSPPPPTYRDGQDQRSYKASQTVTDILINS